MQKITTFLTFNDQAEEAMKFYTSVFRDSKILSMNALGGSFQLHGQEFAALNGGASFSFAQGFSLLVSCETQEEIDELYEKLSEGGSKDPCGWLKDKYGVSWQVIPPILGQYLGDKDPEKANRVMQAMFKMRKIDIQALEDAYAGR